jgi:hypothetical protein
MLVSRDQNREQDQDTKIAKRLYENVSQFKYLGMSVSIQILIQEEIKRILNSGNACCHSSQNFLSSCLLSRNIKIRLYNSIIYLLFNMCVKYGF